MLKSEISYQKIFLISMALIFPLYTLFAVTDTQLLEGQEFEIDYWGAIAGLFVYSFYFIIYTLRIKEKRIRMLTVLPVSVGDISQSRILLTVLPMLTILTYLVIIHYIIIDTWHEETGALLMQIGLCFTLILTVLLIRDIWLIHENRKIYTSIVLSGIVLLLILGFIAWIFISGRLIIYEIFGWDYGRTMFFFVSLLPAFLIHIFFAKRKNFLS